MTPLAYHLAWMALGLLLAAALSGWLVARLRHRLQHAAQARGLLAALRLYALWLAAQRSGLAGAIERGPALAALRRAQALAGRLGPPLPAAMEQVLAGDAAIERFSRRQQALRWQDPEAWLDSDHEAQLGALWQRQEGALQALEALSLHRARSEAAALDAAPPQRPPRSWKRWR